MATLDPVARLLERVRREWRPGQALHVVTLRVWIANPPDAASQLRLAVAAWDSLAVIGLEPLHYRISDHAWELIWAGAAFAPREISDADVATLAAIGFLLLVAERLKFDGPLPALD